MPENYLHLSGDVVDALGRTENNQPLQFNEIQCRLLKQKLQETVTPLLSRVDKDSLPPEKQALFEQRCRGAALLELYRIVKRAEAIIHGCRIPDWLTAAIKLANSFEIFVDIFFKLDWCKAVVGIVFSNALTSELQHVGDNIEGFGEAECAFKMDEIRKILQQPASQDRESLRRRLTEMQEDTGARSKQEIVAYLLKLLTTDPANMEETTFHVLPSIKPEHLRHLRRIGEGGFGSVAEAEWLGQKVAAKIFKDVDARSFRVEANILAGLRHPNIVQIFGVSTGRRQPSSSIVMEIMYGDLSHAIDVLNRETSTSYHREQRFELPVALDIMLQMAEAMQYLHRKKITHRDLKSKNMLINPAQIPEIAEAGYMDVKLADFGTSKIVNATTTISPQTLDIGTRLWMAPEVWYQPEKDSTKLKYYPLKSDVYSYAITCSEILSGGRPFFGVRLGELLEKVKGGLRPPLPNSLPPSLSSLIECCWDGDVRSRPSFSTISTQLRHLKGIYLISDCAGSSQTLSMPPFSIAPEDVDKEIETDERVHDIETLFNTLRDLRREVDEKNQTLREQTEMLMKKDQTLQEREQTIQKLLAREGRFDISQLEEASPVDQKLSLSFSPYQTLREKDKTLQEQGEKLQEKYQVLREEDQVIEKLHSRYATFKCQGCVIQ